jgi:CRP/FNR family transcriptional regulator
MQSGLLAPSPPRRDASADSLFGQLASRAPALQGSVSLRTLQRGQHLYRPNDARSCVYSVHRGALKSYRISQDASERISGFHFPGELLGMETLFGRPVRRGAVALGTASVFMIPAALMLDHMGRCEMTRLELLGHFHAEITRLEEQLSLEQLTAQERLAAFVLWSVDKLSTGSAPCTVRLPMSRKDLGNYLGLAPETVSRLFSRFETRRWVSTNGRELTVQDMTEVRQAASGAEARGGTTPRRGKGLRWPSAAAHPAA